MEDIKNTFYKIRDAKGRNEKKEILKQIQNEDILYLLSILYDKNIKFGIGRKKLNSAVDEKPTKNISNIVELVKYLVENNTGTDVVVSNLQHFIRKFKDEDDRDFIKRVILKDLPYGITQKTLNEVYGNGFIDIHEVQLAKDYIPEKHNPILKKDGFTITRKLDGIRLTIFKYDCGKIVCKTRSGTVVDGLVEIEDDMKLLEKGFVYDGEVIADNPDGLTSDELFRVTSGLFRTKGEKVGLNFVVFKVIRLDEFKQGKSKESYAEIIERLECFNKKYFSKTKRIEMVEILARGEHNTDIISQIFEKTVKNNPDWEGIMIDNHSKPYETKRTDNLLKLKQFHTLDLLCVGVEEGIREGQIGSLVVRYKDGTTRVSGLTMEDKKLFFDNPNLIIGKIIEVEFFEESQDEFGNFGLRFASFKGIRDDKTKPDF